MERGNDMDDITILYYTASIAPAGFSENVRKHLLEITENKIPIISISQKPIGFGHNICVGEIGASVYNEYRQIFEGLKITKTDYIACCEDDTLYVPEHFSYRPKDDNIVSYNVNKWQLDERGIYFTRARFAMLGCISRTDLMYKILEMRFNKYPTAEACKDLSGAQWRGMCEPGKGERYTGLPWVSVERFTTEHPLITFHQKNSLEGSVLKKLSAYVRREHLDPWGSGQELWKKFYGD
jgi:hypothetical protein